MNEYQDIREHMRSRTRTFTCLRVCSCTQSTRLYASVPRSESWARPVPSNLCRFGGMFTITLNSCLMACSLARSRTECRPQATSLLKQFLPMHASACLVPQHLPLSGMMAGAEGHDIPRVSTRVQTHVDTHVYTHVYTNASTRAMRMWWQTLRDAAFLDWSSAARHGSSPPLLRLNVDLADLQQGLLRSSYSTLVSAIM